MSDSPKLTAEEKEILEAYEREEFVSVATPEMRKALAATARKTFKKSKRGNIRVSEKDLELLQARALIEGIPYQSLMASVLHKYVHGRLEDLGT